VPLAAEGAGDGIGFGLRFGECGHGQFGSKRVGRGRRYTDFDSGPCGTNEYCGRALLHWPRFGSAARSRRHTPALRPTLAQAKRSRTGSQSKWSTFASIRGAQLAAHPLPLAPLIEQRRIVAEIEKQTSRLELAAASLDTVETKLEVVSRSIVQKTCERADLQAKETRVGDISECLDRQRIPVNA
jgi:hypothetical protein